MGKVTGVEVTGNQERGRSLSDKKFMAKKFSHDTKVGGRNRTSAFYMRNMTRLGSDVFKKKRPDRIYNCNVEEEEDSDD